MRLISMLFVLFVQSSFLFSQLSEAEEYGANKFFAQGMVNIDNPDTILELQSEMRSIDFLEVVRIDRTSKRFFLLISDMQSVSEDQVRSWFGEFGNDIYCIQVGIHGVDKINSFPFSNCGEK